MARPSSYVMALFLLATLGTVASAQWVQTAGPAGAHFVALAALDELEVAASTRHGSVYAHAEGDWSLQPGVTLPARLHRHGGVWFQIEDGAVLASVDQGLTWSDTELPGAAVAVYVGPEAFYAATTEAVYATTDGGASWSPVVSSLVVQIEAGGSTIEGPLNMNAFAVHEGTFMAPGHVTGFVGLYRTQDGGETWTYEFPSPVSSTPNGFMYRAEALYAVGCYTYRSVDGGWTWDELDTAISTVCLDDVGEVGGDLLAQSTRHGVFRLEGDTWVQAHPTAKALTAHGDAAFTADEHGVYRTADGGTTWTALPMDLVATTAVPYSLGNGSALAVTERGLLFRTDDDFTWTGPTAIDADGLRASALLVHPQAILAATEDGVFRSVDGGLTWAESNTGINYHPFHLDRTPRLATNGEVVMAGFAYGFAQQGHGGTTFGGMYRSDDGGQTWTSMNGTFPQDDEGHPHRVPHLAMSGSSLVAATPAGVYASTDEGASWVLSSGIPAGVPGIILKLQAAGGAFYAFTLAGSLYESTDEGLTWQERRAGIPLMLSLHDAHLLFLEGERYLVVNKNGTGAVYRYDVASWEPVALETPSDVRFAGFSAHGDLVLAGTLDAGVWTVPAGAFLEPTVAVESAPGPTYVLSAAHPNPTRGESRLMLTVSEPQPVRVEVLDALGRRVALLHEGALAAGVEHRFDFEGSGLPSGVYFLRATGDSFSETRHVTLLR